MVWQNGETWQDMRQCVMKSLGGCGMPSAIDSESMEQRIQHEVGKLVREFARFEQDCKPFCPFELLHKAVANVICSVVFGCRFLTRCHHRPSLVLGLGNPPLPFPLSLSLSP